MDIKNVKVIFKPNIPLVPPRLHRLAGQALLRGTLSKIQFGALFIVRPRLWILVHSPLAKGEQKGVVFSAIQMVILFCLHVSESNQLNDP